MQTSAFSELQYGPAFRSTGSARQNVLNKRSHAPARSLLLWCCEPTSELSAKRPLSAKSRHSHRSCHHDIFVNRVRVCST